MIFMEISPSFEGGYFQIIARIIFTKHWFFSHLYYLFFSSLFAQLPEFSFGFGPASACRSPESICSLPRQDGVKGAADSGALAHSG